MFSGLIVFSSFSNSWTALSTIASPFLFLLSESSRFILRSFNSSSFWMMSDLKPEALSTLTVISALFLIELVVLKSPSLRSDDFSESIRHDVTKSENVSLVTNMNCFDLLIMSLTKFFPGVSAFVTELKCFTSFGILFLA